jgi:adenylate cyclase
VAKENPHKIRVRFPIGAKLVLIISILVLVSLGTVTVLVSVISTQDVRRTAEDNNFTVNRRAGSQAESSFKAVQAAVSLYLEMAPPPCGPFETAILNRTVTSLTATRI